MATVDNGVVTVTYKRTRDEINSTTSNIKALLLDIEGTTTPISFVKDTLFPFVRENLKTYLETNWDEEECKNDVAALRELAVEDKETEGAVEIVEGEKDEVIASILANVTWLMNQDRKSSALKQIQGHVWRNAYKAGDIKGIVYDDVVESLKNWTKDEKKVYIYSSGSVEAQKLLFAHSDQGDLSEYLAGYFDMTTGSKLEKDSYTKIAKEIDLEPAQILFLTDNPAEARAASEASFGVVLVVREGNAPLSEDDRKEMMTVDSFKELLAETEEVPSKKTIVEEVVVEDEK